MLCLMAKNGLCADWEDIFSLALLLRLMGEMNIDRKQGVFFSRSPSAFSWRGCGGGKGLFLFYLHKLMKNLLM